jgi:hypothetical protein
MGFSNRQGPLRRITSVGAFRLVVGRIGLVLVVYYSSFSFFLFLSDLEIYRKFYKNGKIMGPILLDS